MPDEVELLDKPVSPLGRLTIWVLFILLGCLLIYSCVGKLNIVATARGAIKPQGAVQLVQMPKTGVINKVLVNEGQMVKKTELLFAVDDNTLAVDAVSYKEQLARAKIEKNALTALLKNEPLANFVTTEERNSYPEIDNYFQSVSAKGATDDAMLLNQKEQVSKSIDILETEKSTIINTINEKNTQLALLQEKQQLGSLQAEINGIGQQINRLLDEEETYRQGVEEGKISESSWQSKVSEREKMEMQLSIKQELFQEQQLELVSQQTQVAGEIDNLTNQVKMKETNIQVAKKQVEELTLKEQNVTATEDKEIATLILEKEKQIKEYDTLVEKGEELLRGEKVSSPIDGTVTDIMVEELGMTLQQSQKVMAIVPKDAELYVESYVQNKDIGFIELGQTVSLKIDSFNFQKYGLLEGSITFISPTSIPKEKVGNVYKVQIKLDEHQPKFKHKEVVLSPGMEVTAEIQTGKRRIIEFFLEPLVKYLDESLKLR